MTLANCITNKVKSGLVSAIKGKAAKDRFKQLSDAFIAQGENPTNAYARAADMVVDEMAEKAARSKHRLLAQVAVMRDVKTRVDAAENIVTHAVKVVDDLDFDARAIHTSANGQIGKFLKENRPTLTGKPGAPARLLNVLKELKGESTGDAAAEAMAASLHDVNEWFRVKLNSYGYNIGKLDDWALSHSHNAVSIANAGFQKWSSELSNSLSWEKMIDPRTGVKFQGPPSQQFQTEYLKAVYDNIIYGRNSRKAEWGNSGIGGGNPLERHRVLSFKDTNAWVAYNAKYGESDPFNTMMHHINRMSREVAVARRFGPDAQAGMDFMEQYLLEVARKRDVGIVEAAKMRGNTMLAKNMLRYMVGSVVPNGYWGAMSAKFFSTTRKTISAALLDRAVVISVPSDLNSARMAAKAIGMNPTNFLSEYTRMMAEAVKGGGMLHDDLLRQGHIGESFANPSVTAGRYQQEMPAAAWAENLSNMAMRIQGMNAHTDGAKQVWQRSMAGHLASMKDMPFDQIPEALRRDMAKTGGITAADWDLFRNSDGLFTASNGATFLDPLYWRQTNSLKNAFGEKAAEDLFLKMQAYVEKWTERAVPSGSLIAKGIIDPLSWGISPGNPIYEIIKSATMFKSFPMAFVVTQVRMLNHAQGFWGKTAYLAELLGATTMVGALGIQVNELMFGRDPQPMDPRDGDFIWRAMMRGGGLGPLGDVLSAGSASWGGGLPSYVAGPVWALSGDAIKLTFGNAIQAYEQATAGKAIDTNFIPEMAKFMKRYTPMGQTPLLLGGSAADRMIWDQLQVLLDPQSADALLKAAKDRKNLYGNGEWWPTGSPLPARLPDLGNAIGR